METHAPGKSRGVLWGLGAALLFGVSAPLAKPLTPGLSPLLFSGLLYLGAGLGLSALGLLRGGTAEAPLRRGDGPLILAMALLGAVLGPLLLLWGLAHLSAVSTSLLLNLEAPLTILIAVALFKDHLGRRELGGVLLVLAGAAAVGFLPGRLTLNPAGVLAILGACLCWAVDSNLSERLSLKDPLAIARAKSLLGGGLATAVAFALSTAPPRGVGWALLLGFGSFGLSLALHIRAQRELGAARQAGLFALAPFVGAITAAVFLHEPLRRADLAGGLAMALGLAALLFAPHSHAHTHEALEHEHLHVHDEHHQHTHQGPVSEPHSHPHRHEPITHAHPHVPDLHHHHRH